LNYSYLRQQAWYRQWRWAINGLYLLGAAGAAIFVAPLNHGPLQQWAYFALALTITSGFAYATKMALVVSLAGQQAFAEQLVEID
jgi:hypothetical protein